MQEVAFNGRVPLLPTVGLYRLTYRRMLLGIQAGASDITRVSCIAGENRAEGTPNMSRSAIGSHCADEVGENWELTAGGDRDTAACCCSIQSRGFGSLQSEGWPAARAAAAGDLGRPIVAPTVRPRRHHPMPSSSVGLRRWKRPA